jgi:pimeloyl-ACP methyl ester carboxylesterase
MLAVLTSVLLPLGQVSSLSGVMPFGTLTGTMEAISRTSAQATEEIIMKARSVLPDVVLVHCGFVDGSGWRGVYDLLTQDGYHVAVVQNPTLSLAGDAAAARLIIDAQDGPVVLVGHSYGGAVISEAGTDPNVAALVYIAAFAPDAGESVNTLLATFPPDAPQPPILPPQGGFLFLDRDKFHGSTTVEVAASHSVYVSQPAAVTACIKQAASTVAARQ